MFFSNSLSSKTVNWWSLWFTLNHRKMMSFYKNKSSSKKCLKSQVEMPVVCGPMTPDPSLWGLILSCIFLFYKPKWWVHCSLMCPSQPWIIHNSRLTEYWNMSLQLQTRDGPPGLMYSFQFNLVVWLIGNQKTLVKSWQQADLRPCR